MPFMVELELSQTNIILVRKLNERTEPVVDSDRNKIITSVACGIVK